jgi:Zn-finger domain-containing protein
MPLFCPTEFSPAETARYTREMLETLSRIATRQGQALLAHLIDLAVVEAQIQCDQADHDTSLPG